MPARVRPSLPVLLAIATAFGISSTLQAYLLQLAVDGMGAQRIWRLFLLNIVYWYVPALSAPLIMLVANRYRFGKVRLPVFIGIHVTGAASYAVLHTAAMIVTRMASASVQPSRGWVFAAQVEFLTQLDWMFMTYLFLVGLAHALAYRAESERRTLDAAHLETRLVEAQLQSLQRQLRPHFLFNTLNTISGLMRTDVTAADRMMDKLQLRIQIRDSGDGLPPDRLTLLNDGVGLGNTRARLQHLYRR